MFKSVMVYGMGDGWLPQAADVQSQLQAQRFVPCGATQAQSVGWIEPRGHEHGPLLESVAGQWIAKLEIETKAVPASVVRRKVDEWVAKIEADTGRKPGKKERRDLQDDILLSLLPQAFARQSGIWVWLDMARRRVVLSAGSQGKADEAVSALLKALPGLSLHLLQTTHTPQHAMTQWLLAASPDEWPADWSVERECTLKSTSEDAASIRYSRHNLSTADVRQHVSEGKWPIQLALSWQGQVGCVLTDALQLKKIQFLDGLIDEAASRAEGERFDADVALATGLLGPLIDSLLDALGGHMQPGLPAPTPTTTHAAAASQPAATLVALPQGEPSDDPPF